MDHWLYGRRITITLGKGDEALDISDALEVGQHGSLYLDRAVVTRMLDGKATAADGVRTLDLDPRWSQTYRHFGPQGDRQ